MRYRDGNVHQDEEVEISWSWNVIYSEVARMVPKLGMLRKTVSCAKLCSELGKSLRVWYLTAKRCRGGF